jgi:mRNA-degrading endonuclease toxin of MazEF toxin-antitoxin module
LAKSRVKYDSPSAQIIKNHENLPAAGKSAFHIIVPVLKRIVIKNLVDILVDQVRAIDNHRLIRNLGQLTANQAWELRNNIRIVLD